MPGLQPGALLLGYGTVEESSVIETHPLAGTNRLAGGAGSSPVYSPWLEVKESNPHPWMGWFSGPVTHLASYLQWHRADESHAAGWFWRPA
jgi:hypothetical protein